MSKRKSKEVEELQKKFRKLQEQLVLFQEENQEIPITSEDSDLEDKDEEHLDEIGDELSVSDEENKENNSPEVSQTPNVSEVENVLEMDIQEVLGEDPLISQALDAKLHSNILNRWKHWFTNGLPKEDRDTLLKKYDSPPGLKVPLLNPEIELKLQKHSKARDFYMSMRQQMAGSALTSIGWAITNLIEEKESVDKLFLIERLSDAGKLIADMMNSQSKSRSASILAGLDKDTRAILEKTTPDEFLFGKNLSDKIKEAKSMDKVANSLKANKFVNNRFPLRQNLNFNSLPGKQHFPYQAGYRPGYQYQQGPSRPRLAFRNRQNQPFNQKPQYLRYTQKAQRKTK